MSPVLSTTLVERLLLDILAISSPPPLSFPLSLLGPSTFRGIPFDSSNEARDELNDLARRTMVGCPWQLAEPSWYNGLNTPYYNASHVAWRAKLRDFFETEVEPSESHESHKTKRRTATF